MKGKGALPGHTARRSGGWRAHTQPQLGPQPCLRSDPATAGDPAGPGGLALRPPASPRRGRQGLRCGVVTAPVSGNGPPRRGEVRTERGVGRLPAGAWGLGASPQGGGGHSSARRTLDRQALAPQSPAWSMDFELGIFQNSPLSHPAPRVLALEGRADGPRVVLVPRAAKSTALSPGLRHRSPPVSSERGITSAKFTSSSAPPSTCVNRETVHRLTV